jgi:hypothetical protein
MMKNLFRGRRGFAIIIAAIALIEGSASCQTTTDCYTLGSNTTCTTHPPLGAPPANDAIGSFTRDYIRQRNESTAQSVDAIRAARQKDNREKLAAMIQAHDCEGAVAFALKEGGIDIALKVKQICN